MCALNGKFNKSFFTMLSFVEESPEGASPLCTGVTPRNAKHSRTPLKINDYVSKH